MDLSNLKSLSQEVKSKSTLRGNFTIFGEYITAKLRKLGETLTDDEMDSIEFEVATVIEKARKLIFHSVGVPQ